MNDASLDCKLTSADVHKTYAPALVRLIFSLPVACLRNADIILARGVGGRSALRSETCDRNQYLTLLVPVHDDGTLVRLKLRSSDAVPNE